MGSECSDQMLMRRRTFDHANLVLLVATASPYSGRLRPRHPCRLSRSPEGDNRCNLQLPSTRQAPEPKEPAATDVAAPPRTGWRVVRSAVGPAAERRTTPDAGSVPCGR